MEDRDLEHRDVSLDWESALDRVRTSANTQQLLRLAVSLCRRISDRFPVNDCINLVDAVERLSESPDVDSEDYSVSAEVDSATESLQQMSIHVSHSDVCERGAYLAAVSCGGMWHDPRGLIEAVATTTAIAAAGCNEGPDWDAERRIQTALFIECLES